MQSQVTSLNSKTTFELTVPSGISILNSKCYTLGKIVFISARIKIDGGTTDKAIIIDDAIPSNLAYNGRLGFAAFNNGSDESLHGLLGTRAISFYRPETTLISEIEFSLSYAL